MSGSYPHKTAKSQEFYHRRGTAFKLLTF